MGERGEEAMHEYQTLRDEIARLEEQIFDVFKFALTGAVAIISFALQQAATGNKSAWAIAATVPLVVIPAGLLTLARAQQEMRIGAYLMAFFETNNDALNWEHQLRGRCREDRRPDRMLELAMFSGYALTGLAGVVLAGILAWGDALGVWVVGGEVVAVAVIIVVAVRIAVAGKRGEMEHGDIDHFMRERWGQDYASRHR